MSRMIDEEMAGEWIKKNTVEFDDEELGLVCIKEPSSEDCFLAGLAAGRLRWHNIRKHPEDLPNCEHGHVVFNQDLDRVIIRDGRFEFLDGYEANVIAWCEIQKFKED